MAINKRLLKNKGFGLTEVMVALTILSIALLGLIPMFIYATKATLRNNYRTTAYNLGVRQLERVKSMTYDDVGIDGSSPDGILTSPLTEVVRGISYTVSIRVDWKDDPSDGLQSSNPPDNDPRDFKVAKITISSPTGSNLPSQVFTTNISRQSEEQIAVGGHINVTVVDPVVDQTNANTPIADARVRVTTGPSSPLYVDTNDEGIASFLMLTPSQVEDDYTLTLEKDRYVIEPTMVNQITTVVAGQTQNMRFLISRPGRLAISLLDENGQLIDSASQISLYYPSAPAVNYNSSTGDFGTIDGLYPGRYEIRATNPFFELRTERDVAINADTTTTLQLRLQRKAQANLQLRVLDNASNPIPNATVAITNLDSNFSETNTTDTNGILERQLWQGSFRIEVSKNGYQTNTQEITLTNPDTALTVNLEPIIANGSIRVRVLRRNGNPRPGVRIRVTGPNNYNVQQFTAVNGETLFGNLAPNTYTVERRRGRSWIFIGNYDVVSNQEQLVIARY